MAAGTPAYKGKEIGALLAYFAALLAKHGVEVSLGTEVRPGGGLPTVGGEPAEVVVLALGATPKCPDFAGAERVVSVFEVLRSKGVGVGRRVAVIGSSGVGIDTALYLAESAGREMTVVEMADEVGGKVNEFLKRHTLGMAAQKQIRFLTGWTVVAADGKGLKARTLLGERMLEAGMLFEATQR